MGPLKEAVLASAAMVGLVWLAKSVGGWAPAWAAQGVVTAVWALHLYGPFWRADRGDVSSEHLGLRNDRWRSDLKWAALWAVGITVPYSLAYGLWAESGFTARWPVQLTAYRTLEIAVLAGAEEVFFRGYLQRRYDDALSTRWSVLGVSVGWGWLWASAVFALAHLVGEWNPARLAVFFPSLVFGWLRAKTGSVWGATGFHAHCNFLQLFLQAGFRG